MPPKYHACRADIIHKQRVVKRARRHPHVIFTELGCSCFNSIDNVAGEQARRPIELFDDADIASANRPRARIHHRIANPTDQFSTGMTNVDRKRYRFSNRVWRVRFNVKATDCESQIIRLIGDKGIEQSDHRDARLKCIFSHRDRRGASMGTFAGNIDVEPTGSLDALNDADCLGRYFEKRALLDMSFNVGFHGAFERSRVGIRC